MQETLVQHVQSLYAQYKAGHAELSETESTPKKEWQATLVTETFEESVSELLSPVTDRAVATDDPAELLAILEGVQDLVGDLKQWLNSMYFAATRREIPAVNAEELEAIFKQIQDTIKSAHALKASGMDVDPDAILSTLPTKTRKVKGGATKVVPDIPRIRVKTRGQRRVGDKSKTTKLVVNGTVQDDSTLGDSLRKVGLTWETFQEMTTTKWPDVTNPWNKEDLYSTEMFVLDDGTKIGLRMVK